MVTVQCGLRVLSRIFLGGCESLHKQRKEEEIWCIGVFVAIVKKEEEGILWLRGAGHSVGSRDGPKVPLIQFDEKLINI